MTKMIERWFPCAEVSANSTSGWGSGNTERNLFTWFAARPTAQAKAAVLCSLLPWPDDAGEQHRLQQLVSQAMSGRYAAWQPIRQEILRANPSGTAILDPFSGRGMIPLEAARLGLPSHAIDYSPVAVLASELLTDYCFRDWDSEATLPYPASAIQQELYDDCPRLLRDVSSVLAEVGRRFETSMAPYYPAVNGRQPWAYLWTVTLPCPECSRRYPLYGSNVLQTSYWRGGRGLEERWLNPGQSFRLEVDHATGSFEFVAHDGKPRQAPTLTKVEGRGKSAVCPFCSYVMPASTCRRLTDEGYGQDHLALVADHDEQRGKFFREPTSAEREAIRVSHDALSSEKPFGPFLPAVPDEGIAPGNNNIIGPSIYGARRYGDLCNTRQTLSFVRLARHHNDVFDELVGSGLSHDYARALCSFSASALVRKLMRSTRGAQLLTYRDGRPTGINNIWVNETSLTFSYDNVEIGLARGAGSWQEVSSRTLKALKTLLEGAPQGQATLVERGSATSLALKSESIAAVVTDPPYDEMIPYGDASDLYYVWVRRALASAKPELTISADPFGAQEKTEEIIVKRARGLGSQTDYVEHRTRGHYDTMLAAAFREMRRVVQPDGVVTIVFGHGEPEVWQRLLLSLQRGGLVMTGSWPANTEGGGQQGKANIQTTLTMACRPAPARRPTGRKGAVETEIKTEIKQRYPDWERWGLAPADMLMAAAGPAMEVVGRYREVLDATGEPVDIHTFLPLSRAAVQEAMAVEIDHHPLETFDARTRFALWWVRLYGRQLQAKSELRWQTLASSLELAEVRDLVPEAGKGVRFVLSHELSTDIDPESAVIDVALSLAAASEEGLESMGAILAHSGRGTDDPYLWATVQFLADRLPDSDPDAIAFTRVLRTRDGIAAAAENAIDVEQERRDARRTADAQLKLM